MASLNTSHSKPVITYPTPLLQDVEVITTHDARLADYQPLEYGSLYSDQVRFPGLKLIHQEPVDGEDRIVRRFWAADRQNQDLYNADFKYSGGSHQHPIIVRRYLFPESGYTPLQTGAADSQFPDAKLVQEEVSQPENRNGYLAVTRVFETLPGPALSGVLVTDKGQVATITSQVVAPGTTVTPSALTVSASVKPDSKGKSVLEKVEVPEVFPEKSLSTERPDLFPEKFRSTFPIKTEEIVLEGAVSDLSLASGEIASSEQQLTKFTKRRRKVKRDLLPLPKSLTQLATNQQQQPVYITETLQTGDTTRRPTATVSISSESLGEGTYVVKAEDSVEVLPAPVYSIESVDLTPPKFKSRLPSRSEEITRVGSAGKPELRPDELSRTVTQVDKFKYRSKVTKKPIGVIPTSFTQVSTNDKSQRVVVTETLDKQDTTLVPSATLSIESEAIGDGNYLIKQTELPGVFAGKLFSSERAENVPQKFQSKLPTTVEEETVQGTAGVVTLAAGEISGSEQQLTEFTKRKRKAYRSMASLPQTLTQVATNEKGQKITVTEVYKQGDSTETPSARKIVQSEALGDGTYIVRTSVVDEVFDEKRIEVRKSDVIPEKFKSNSTPITTVELVSEAASVSTPTLNADTIAISQQRTTNNTVRTVTTTRPTSALSVLSGQQYDEKLDVVIPYKESVTASGENLGDDSTEIIPLSPEFDLVKTYDYSAIKTKLERFHLQIPSVTNLSLPDKLISAAVVWGASQGEGSSKDTSSGYGKSFSYNSGASSQTSNSIAGDVSFVFEKGYSGPVPSTKHVFFVPSENVTTSKILEKLGSNVKSWPSIKMRSQNIVLVGRKSNKKVVKSKGESKSIDHSTAYLTSDGRLSYSGDSGSKSESESVEFDVGSVVNSVAVPPALNSGISISQQTFGTSSLAGSFYPSSLSATSPAKFPTGSFLYDVAEEIYGFGFIKITALVINLTSEYV